MKKNNKDKKDTKKKEKYPWEKYYIDMKTSFEYEDISMYEMVRRSSEKYPKSTAYTYYGTKVTYKKFIKKIDEIAYSFHRLGVRKKTNVTICMPNTPEAIISIYALNKLGALINIVHPLSSEEELKYALNITNAEYLLVIDMAFNKIHNILSEVNLKKIIYSSVSDSMDTTTKFGYFFTKGIKIGTPYGENVISWSDFDSFNKYGKDDIKDVGKKDDEAIILYSGGTTGKQKGIVLTNNNFNSLVISGVEINKTLKNGRSILGIMPIFHGFGLGCTFHSCFSFGAEAIILPTVDPKKFDEVILKYKPNVMACVPSLLETLTYSKKMKEADLSFINCIACGGDSISEALETRLNAFLKSHNCSIKIRGGYGLTEVTACVTMMPFETTKVGSIGIPLPGTIIKICKPGTIDELEPNTEGEICISGPTVMKEYYKEKEETKKVLKKHKDGRVYLHSGDMGYIDLEGFVYFESRIKRLIVSSGYNIYPSQIEKVIMSSPYVKSCLVIGVPHPYKKEVAKAYIVLKDEIELTNEIKRSIKELCKKNVSSYALPYAYCYRKDLPKTKIGKIAYTQIDDKDNLDEDNLHD